MKSFFGGNHQRPRSFPLESLFCIWAVFYTRGSQGLMLDTQTNGLNGVQKSSKGTEPVSRRDWIRQLALVSLCRIEMSPLQVNSMSPDEAASAYDSYAKEYDSLDGGQASSLLGIDAARDNLFAEASGAVLEIGAGTGLNLKKYDLTKVSSITLVDVSAGMLEEAKKRALDDSILSHFPISFVQADATSDLVALFGEHQFDSVAASFCLCVMGKDGAMACLRQIRDVVKKKRDGGKILLLENSRSSNPLIGAYQDMTANAAAVAGGKGCVYNQDVVSMIKSIGGLNIGYERQYAAGLFRAYKCLVE